MGDFDWRIYKQLNGDLRKKGINTQTTFTKHWINYGKKEHRKYCVRDITPNFNWENYKYLNPDLKLTNKFEYEMHWLTKGLKDGRPHELPRIKLDKFTEKVLHPYLSCLDSRQIEKLNGLSLSDSNFEFKILEGNGNYILNTPKPNLLLVNLLTTGTTPKIIEIEAKSSMNTRTNMSIFIDGVKLPMCDYLNDHDYLTINWIDMKLFPQPKTILISTESCALASLKIRLIQESDLVVPKEVFIGDVPTLSPGINACIPKNILAAKIGIICDDLTFNSLASIINLRYISSKEVDNLPIDDLDFLLCESTWHGMDGSWKNELGSYGKLEYGKKINKIVERFQKCGKKTIFYNKEDPTNYTTFLASIQPFDIIITTSQNSLSNYRLQYPNKPAFARSFCINPIKHNPIRFETPLEEVAFAGGFYKHFEKRTEDTEKLFQILTSIKQKPVVIYNRHSTISKQTYQLKYLEFHKGRYDIPGTLSNIAYPCIPGNLVPELVYKKYKYHCNINTVTNCSTMCSRRAVELAGCGCYVLSNSSLFLRNFFGDSFSFDKYENYLQKQSPMINMKAYYLAHLHLSYVKFMKELYTLANLPGPFDTSLSSLSIKKGPGSHYDHNYTTEVKIFDNNGDNIPEKGLLLFNRQGYYYDNDFIRKLLITRHYWLGNVAFTTNPDQLFRIMPTKDIPNELLVIDCKSDYTLYINDLHNPLYDNVFDFESVLRSVNIPTIADGILVVMCTWKRSDNIIITLNDLNKQTIINNTPINLCIWNNNFRESDKLAHLIKHHRGKIRVYQINSKQNCGAIGRFLFVKGILRTQPSTFNYVIFIDDDQTFGESFLQILLEEASPKSSYHWYGKIFYPDRGYWDAWKNIRYQRRTDFKYDNFDENILDYGGTGGMIIDIRIFENDVVLLINKKYQFVEDLWLSYLENKMGWVIRNGKRLQNIIQNLPSANDNDAQWTKLRTIKDTFLQSLRIYGEFEWHVSLNTGSLPLQAGSCIASPDIIASKL